MANLNDAVDQIDRSTKEIFIEITRLLKENKMLQEECSALRSQVRELERQVYNGSTM
jgi:predicted  nucleic acid-binding Zn-ribbon protein